LTFYEIIKADPRREGMIFGEYSWQRLILERDDQQPRLPNEEEALNLRLTYDTACDIHIGLDIKEN
jgi:hypothetical protein